MFGIRLFTHTILLVVLSGQANAAEMLGEFEIREHRYTSGDYKNEPFRYLVLPPKDVEDGKRYPMVVFLHGAGERGNDPEKLLPHFPTQMTKPEWREKYPCFLVVPQCRDDKLWMNQHWSEKESKPLDEKPNDQMQMAIEVVDRCLKELPIDPKRIYLTGLSMGGYGAWEMAMRRPELFAALAPVCAGGDETKAARLKDIPIWTAHGDADRSVPVERSRRMVAAVREAGGNVRYTEYEGVGHNSWTQFYAEPDGVVAWMFRQRKVESQESRVESKEDSRGSSDKSKERDPSTLHLQPSTKDDRVDFSREIRPILAKSCFGCHGNDSGSREAELRLDRRDDALRDREGRRVIVAGDSASSELIKRITAADADARMPPADAGEPLTAEQVQLFRRWIDQGAEYSAHWAFVKPQQTELPVVKDESWPRNAIDRFILAALERRGWKPSSQADRSTLIRRLSLDLIGLPPTPEEVDAFVNDNSPKAYEKLVERLLGSPRFGERWAQVWLDLARYADSMGYEKDLPRTIWRYRDWVIDAFNDDMPFDRFTIEQLAGDLLPDATLDQRIATAMHRNTLTNQEGGTDDEEFRVAAVKDRVDTTLQVWMGLTMGCAKCHSHKYDPITNREYYQFYAVFNQTADADRGDDAPTIVTPTREQQRRIDDLDRQIAAVANEFVAFRFEMRGGFDDWLQKVSQDEESRKKLPKEIDRIVAIDAEQRTRAHLRRLQAHFARNIAEQNDVARKKLAELQAKRAAVKPPRTPVLQELPAEKRRDTRIHVRGNFLEQGDAVGPAVPEAFGSLPESQARDRLAVARWLVDRDNPLTARVQVNRFWARLFGRGLVLTEEDFGTQGTVPSHSELLDWLAVEFMDRGWSVKELLRLIVTSATYQQSSHVTPELQKADAENVWLARGPRFRLEAETLRDQALAAAGLLSPKTHGPSVMPPQPPGIWKVTYSKLKWETASDENRYRRALYTYWRRTSPYPSMLTFDAGTRETCVLRRVRTNTPLQALVTLNDPVYVEAAGGLALRIIAEGGPSMGDRIERGFRLALVRKPAEFERQRLQKMWETARSRFESEPKEAQALIESARTTLPEELKADEFATWIVVSNVLLNLDEVMMKP